MEIDASDAKTHLASLLDRVTKGERITITRRGIPAAMLVPIAASHVTPTHNEIVEGFRALRKRVRAGKASVQEMLREGRRS